MAKKTITVNEREWEMFQKWKRKNRSNFQKLTKEEFLTTLFEKMDFTGDLEAMEESPSNLEEFFQCDYSTIFFQLGKRPNVKFDLENFDCMNDWSHVKVGWNDEGWLSFICGGDWEIPVFGIIYFDGKNFMCYVPEDGNCFNKKRMEAWGNNDGDKEIMDKIDVETAYDLDLMNNDIKFFLGVTSEDQE